MIWTTLLRLRTQLQQAPAQNSGQFSENSNTGTTLRWNSHQQGLKLHFERIGENATPLTLEATSPFNLNFSTGHTLLDNEKQELQLYLPYALLPWFSYQQNRTFAISHFAQTLDGRIASTSGDSKWIGNQENLTHAHKMRALCDAILVGTSTLRADQPRLSVRHVAGVNPLRVILGNNVNREDIRSDNTSPVLLINKQRSAGCNLEQITLAATDGKIDCREILRTLFEREINSIYIEGGAATTSHFLKSSSLDQVQIHLSPRILGSGTTGFQFDGISTMEQAVAFCNPRFLSIGDQIMFVGEVSHGES